MLNGISWGEYTFAVTLAFMAYYAAIGLWIYVQRLKVTGHGDHVAAMGTQNEGSGKKESVPQTSFSEASEEDFKQVEALMEILKDTIAEAFYKKYGRKQLLDSLKITLEKHPQYIDTPFQVGVHKFIISQCNRHGPVGLHVDELKGLWSAEG